MYDNILFDLDGTLTDPGLGITNSVMYALKKYGIKVDDRAQLYKFIGPPLVYSFHEFYGFSHEQTLEAIKFYREYYAETGIFENEVYDGIIDVLCKLKDDGRRIILATSKPEQFAKRILDHFNLTEYFDFVAGASMDEVTRNTKSAVIKYALENTNIDVSKSLMIGDREHDVLGAKEFGIDAAGVLYGYGSKEELENAGAKYIVESVQDIIKFC